MRYHEMVGMLRAQIPANVDFRIARVEQIDTSADIQSVTLDDGLVVSARLLVAAAGTGPKVQTLLSGHRRQIRSRHSFCAGFDIATVAGGSFPFESLTYWADSLDEGIDFISLFPVPGTMRVNLFGYVGPRDPWVRMVSDAPRVAIERASPS
jgi:hypothetical protein